MVTLFQLLATGVAMGAVYALVGLGFALIYNSSHIVNFAQGEFLMLGGMATAFLIAQGAPLPVAIMCAVLGTAVVGMLFGRFVVEPMRNAPMLSLLLLTIGAAVILRGAAMLLWDKEVHTLPGISGQSVLRIGGVAIAQQALWVVGATIAVVAGVEFFFRYTRLGKAMLAASYNSIAAQLVGISPRAVLLLSFGLSAGIGSMAGVLVTPLTFTSYDAGIVLGIKGFSAAIIGGMGNGLGAVLGGLILGITEAMAAGYISSAYKDAIALFVILLVMLVTPNGILGKRTEERV